MSSLKLRGPITIGDIGPGGGIVFYLAPNSTTDLDGDGKINFLEFHEIMRKKNSTNKRKMDQTPPKPPDGGWGWVIVFACFLCNFVVGNQMCFVV